MWYVLSDTIPANSSRLEARETSIRVSDGVLHTIYAQIPSGVAGLAHFQLRKESYYVLPRNEDESITGDNNLIEFKEWLELRAAENTLTLRTWNTDETYSHKIALFIGVIPREVAEMEDKYLRTLRLFLRLFRRRTE